MKKNILILASILITGIIYAQRTVGTQEQLKQFVKTKTLIVTDNNPLSEYNFEIKESVKRSWKITDYEFISIDEYDKKRKNPKYSFLTVDKVFFDKDKTQAQYEFLCLSLGGNYRTINDMPQLCTVPLCYFGVNEESYVYKIGTLINFVQNHILLTSKNPDLKTKNMIKYYNDNMESVKDKTLYLVKDEMAKEVDSEREIKEIYPYKFKFVSRDDIDKAIENKNDEVVFLHKVGPEGTKSKARCYKILIGADDAKLYYFDWHKIKKGKRPDGFLAKDFKKIS